MNLFILTVLIFAMNIAVILVALAYCRIEEVRPTNLPTGQKCSYVTISAPRHARNFVYYSFITLTPKEHFKTVPLICFLEDELIMNELLIYLCDWSLPPFIWYTQVRDIIIERLYYSSRKESAVGFARIVILHYCSQNITNVTGPFSYMMTMDEFSKRRVHFY